MLTLLATLILAAPDPGMYTWVKSMTACPFRRDGVLFVWVPTQQSVAECMGVEITTNQCIQADIDQDCDVDARDLELASWFAADFDRDGDADMVDFAVLQRCLGSLMWIPETPAECAACDLDRDGMVTPADVDAFADMATIPNIE